MKQKANPLCPHLQYPLLTIVPNQNEEKPTNLLTPLRPIQNPRLGCPANAARHALVDINMRLVVFPRVLRNIERNIGIIEYLPDRL